MACFFEQSVPPVPGGVSLPLPPPALRVTAVGLLGAAPGAPADGSGASWRPSGHPWATPGRSQPPPIDGEVATRPALALQQVLQVASGCTWSPPNHAQELLWDPSGAARSCKAAPTAEKAMKTNGFLMIFKSPLEPPEASRWLPGTPPRSPEGDPRIAQGVPRSASGPPEGPPKSPGTLPNAPEDLPRRPRGGPRQPRICPETVQGCPRLCQVAPEAPQRVPRPPREPP